MSRNARGWMYVIFAVLIMCITLGYAYLNTKLDINGTTNITSANWNIYWDNIQFGSNNVTDVTTPATISSGLTEVTFNVNFKQPGDTYEFTVDAVNDGSINAMVSVVSNGVYAANGTTPKTLPDYLEYTVTYSDGVPIAQNHLLEAGDTETYKVKVHYKEDITASQLPSTNDNYMFKFYVTYAQATTSAVPAPHPTSFADDDWSTIINAVRVGATSNYHVGDTKTVDMGSLGTHTLRIANKSTPSECSSEGFSQTACGFVLEFDDIIIKKDMHYSNTTRGGWEDSTMRNSYIPSIINELPETLKNNIIDTKVVSGYGIQYPESNFITIDKMYILSSIEIYGETGLETIDESMTRQLDYYSERETSLENYSSAIKYYNETATEWWLRSPTTDETLFASTSKYLTVKPSGNLSNYLCHYISGVSPAFRLG